MKYFLSLRILHKTLKSTKVSLNVGKYAEKLRKGLLFIATLYTNVHLGLYCGMQNVLLVVIA